MGNAYLDFVKRHPESLVNWDMLDGCFGDTNVKPTDIDGCVEQRGILLKLERKRHGKFGGAQERVFFTTAMQAEGNLGLVFWCKEQDGSDVRRIQVYTGYRRIEVDGSLDVLREIVKRWWNHAQTLNYSRVKESSPEPQLDLVKGL